MIPSSSVAQDMRVEPKDLFTSEKAVWLRGVPVIKGETSGPTPSEEADPMGPCSYVSHEKRAPGWLGYVGDYIYILPSYIGIIRNHYKDPY